MGSQIESNDNQSRISRIERDLVSLGENYKSLGNDISDIKEALKDFREAISSRSRTNWGALISFGALLAGVVGGYTTLSLNPINEKIAILTGSNGDAIKQLDVNLQREMRDLDAVATAALKHLDEVLQREMNLMYNTATTDRLALKDRIELMEERMLLKEAKLDAMAVKYYEGLD